MTVRIRVGELRQVGTLSNPGAPVPDGYGGFTQTYSPLDPAQWRFAIQTASVSAAEKNFAATVIGHASYIFNGRFHPGIGMKTRIVWVDRNGDSHTAEVLDVNDTEGAGVETVVLVSEIV